MDVAGKTAVVTGAGSGIGRVIALRLAGASAAVVVNDIDDAAGAGTTDEIAELGGTATFVRGDVTSPADIEALVAHAETVGGLRRSIRERRSPSVIEYRGFERRRPLIG